MEHALRPGMRVMRRLGVAGKFGLIAVLLLLPLCTSIIASFQESTGQIAFATRERDGLTYVQPLVHLVVTLTQARDAALDERRPEAGWTTVLREVDRVNDELGDALGVRADWTRLRADVEASFAADAGTETIAQRAAASAKGVQQLVKKVADASNLSLDPQLDSRYVMIVLVDRLPRMLVSASDARQLRGSGTDSLAMAIAANDLKDAARQLSLDLTTALSATSWSGLRQQVGAEAWALSAAVSQYSAALTTPSVSGSAATSAVTSAATSTVTSTVTSAATSTVTSAAASAAASATTADSDTLSASASALGNVLGGALDQLLEQRQQNLMNDRTQPLLITLVALVIAFYLLMALFRATTRDVRSVLAEISTVTSGTVLQSPPLQGSDEFAQMSRAVVYARDRLTALVGTLKFQATHDELTALGNRTLFTEKVEDALAGNGPRAAVLLINLDGFKDVNDSFGHDLGDRLLRTIGARIHRSVPRRSVVARLGGDEFAVLLNEARTSATEVAARLEQALAQPVDIDGRRMRVQAGVGLAEGDPGSLSAVELIRNADVALNVAKDRGKGHTVLFEPSMHDATRERTELSADLVQAVDRGELAVVYQPIVDLATGTLHGVEALARWNHPQRGPISPTVFVPLAEATGLIVPIGRWVLEQACEQLAAWQRSFPDGYPLTVDVNLSNEQLNERDLVADVLALVEETGIDATALVLEITESSLAQDVETAQRRLGQLAAVGLKIALDDFGTGYSSLSYLRRLPVRILKVDKSFVTDADPQGRALLRSIVDLGTHQGMQIIAEGVEHPEQARLLREAGCHLGQGYLWARPLPAAEITEILRRGGLMLPVPAQRVYDH